MTDTTIGDAPTGTSVAKKAEEAISEQVTTMKETGRSQVRTQLDERTTQAGQEMRSLADALRRSGSELEQESGGGSMNRVAEGVADRMERIGGYLEGAAGEDILRDAEAFARRRPWLVAGAAAAVGFAASRLLKASSEDRYSRSNGGDRSSNWQSLTAERRGSDSGRVEPYAAVGGSTA